MLSLGIISEHSLGISYQTTHSSYLKGFPQRDSQLSKELSNYFKVSRIVVSHRNFQSYEFDKWIESIDIIYLLNPLHIVTLCDCGSKFIVFDYVDWYDEICQIELGSTDITSIEMKEKLDTSLKVAQRIVFQSKELLRHAESTYDIRKKPSIVVPNGYDSRYFYPVDQNTKHKLREELYRRHNIDLSDKILLVYQGKMGLWYRKLEYIIEALSYFPECFLVCIGDGPLLNHLRKMAPDNVFFTGLLDIEGVSKWTRSADGAVFPTDDCSPIAISEYLGCSLPIAAYGKRSEWLVKLSGGINIASKYNWKDGIAILLERTRGKSRCSLEEIKRLDWSRLSKKLADFLYESY